jgi:hypothetical protein
MSVESRLAGAASMAAYLAAASVLLSWVALFNGAPLVFADTISYATAAFQREVSGLFSIFYSIFILPLHRGISFWPIVFVQGALIAHFLNLTARYVLREEPRKLDLLIIIAALSIFSSLPWITGEILPDVFTPIVLLGILLLGYSADMLSRGELFYVAAVTVIAITTHLSHVPIAAGLIVWCIGLQLMFSGGQLRIKQLGRLLVTFSLALSLMLLANWINSREFVLARNSNVFLLAKWIDEGPALAYLKKACPAEGYALCAYLPELEGKTHDALKWGRNSPFAKVGTFDELEPEARAIVRATLYSYPYDIVRKALSDFVLQLSRFGTGEGLSQDFAQMVADQLRSVYGSATATPFVESRQGQNRLPISEFRCLHLIGLGAGVGLCLWSLWAKRDEPRGEFFLLCAFVFVGIVWNAAVTGALSGAYDRYLARVIWLICFVGLLGLFCVVRSDRGGSRSSSRSASRV